MLSAFALWLCAGEATAASYDPSLTWRQLRSDHFVVTYHDGEAQLAGEMAEAAEKAWDTLTVEIASAPKQPIQLVLVDWTDVANGYATVVPQNTIVVFVTAPEDDSTLSLYEDWNSAIITHELTHILHISTVRGAPAVVRAIMGSLISTHQISPGWIVEGYATFEETRQTGAGRGRSAMVDMIKRATVLEDRFPPLGNMDGFQVLSPGGNLRYLFGQDFIQFIADTRGAEKWTEWVQRYGASVPYLLPAHKIFGASFVKLYREWRAAVGERYTAQARRIEAEGLTPVEYLTPADETCGTPSWSPDGTKSVWACSSPRVGSRTFLADENGANPKVVLHDKGARTFAWRGDGEAFAFSTTHTVNLYSVLEDVYLYDIEADDLDSLTSGARARDPSFSPDGSKMLVVTNERQDNQLAVLTVDQQLRPLTHSTDHTQYGTPRWSPDGRLIATSVWKDGMRDLWLYLPDGTPWRRLTADTAIDREPTWSPDGRWLYFTSDRSGVPTIYAIELATERVFRVVNVLTGAWGPAPHPDGKRLAFQVYSTMGTRVALAPLDPSTWKDQGPLPRLVGQPAGALTGPDIPTITALPAPVDTKTAEAPEAPPEPGSVEARSRPYNPLPTLLPPRFWVPGGYLTSTGDSYGLLGLAATYGYDTLQYFAYSAYVTYRTDAAFLGGGGSFTINRWRPVLTLGGSTSVSPYTDVLREVPPPQGGGATIPSVESTLQRYWDRRVRGYASLAYPIDDRSSVSAFYTATLRSPLDPLPDDVYLAALPTRGFFSSIGAGWRYAKGTSYALSISPEKARSIAIGAEYTPSWLGSWTYDEAGKPTAFNQLQATAEWREYVTNPWVANHVLAWKLAGGATIGDRFKYGSFRLGGDFTEGGITVVPSEWRALRGYFPATDSGEWYWLGSAEYRLPIVNIDRGVGTFPLFVRNISGAVFADAGHAFDDAEGFAEVPLVGVGAELRLYTILSYGYGVYTRVGYGFGLTGAGIPFGDPDGFYATLGSSF